MDEAKITEIRSLFSRVLIYFDDLEFVQLKGFPNSINSIQDLRKHVIRKLDEMSKLPIEKKDLFIEESSHIYALGIELTQHKGKNKYARDEFVEIFNSMKELNEEEIKLGIGLLQESRYFN